MAPLSSATLVLIFALLLFALSVPTQSEKIQLSRRNLALTEQEPEDQPLAKPKTKKKSAALIEQEEEEAQALTKPKSKKKGAALAEQEEEEVQALTKPKSKKKGAALIEQEEDVRELPQPKTKQKSAALIEQEEEEAQSITKSTTKKKNPTSDSKNQTKPIKPKKSNSTSTSTSSSAPKSNKLNKTLTLRPTNSTKNSTKTPKPPPKSSTSSPKTQLESARNPAPKKSAEKTRPVNPDPIWLDESDSDQDLISEFRGLPTRIHQTLLPDLKKISITSKAYIYKANKNIAQNVKPFVGNKYAPKIAAAPAYFPRFAPAVWSPPLFLHPHSYLSLQRFLIFVQAPNLGTFTSFTPSPSPRWSRRIRSR
ncbi:uncharacterized protein A4U43_C03F2090 [Asparagus officinalis]|uniref:Uncharacterized protein n=1 Tax=Asparagus officinalis TaxID=4686 RepID=A0A5P1F771_ASPOF|nr:uncharacterized protein A4U43_C03F2090 [Asparagus officinalis]